MRHPSAQELAALRTEMEILWADRPEDMPTPEQFAYHLERHGEGVARFLERTFRVPVVAGEETANGVDAVPGRANQ